MTDVVGVQQPHRSGRIHQTAGTNAQHGMGGPQAQHPTPDGGTEPGQDLRVADKPPDQNRRHSAAYRSRDRPCGCGPEATERRPQPLTPSSPARDPVRATPPPMTSCDRDQPTASRTVPEHTHQRHRNHQQRGRHIGTVEKTSNAKFSVPKHFQNDSTNHQKRGSHKNRGAQGRCPLTRSSGGDPQTPRHQPAHDNLFCCQRRHPDQGRRHSSPPDQCQQRPTQPDPASAATVDTRTTRATGPGARRSPAAAPDKTPPRAPRQQPP